MVCSIVLYSRKQNCIQYLCRSWTEWGDYDVLEFICDSIRSGVELAGEASGIDRVRVLGFHGILYFWCVVMRYWIRRDRLKRLPGRLPVP